MKKMHGKSVLVTGATSGIGEQLAHRFASLGATPILVARSADRLEQLAAQLKASYGCTVHVITADLAAAGGARSVFEATRSRQLEVDILVNNAGQGRMGEFTANDYAEYAQLLQLNVSALTELCWLYLPGMKARKRGGIINIASNIALVPGPYMAVYSASKSYVLKFSESLAGEVEGSDVVISCACPGRTRTGFANAAGAGVDFYDGKPYATAEQVGADIVGAFLRGKTFVVTGPQKFMMAQLPRFVPRQFLINMMSRVSRKLYA